MTTDDLPADAPREVVEQIAEARIAREQHTAELGQVMETRRELAPLWARLGLGQLHDSFGVELEVALVPRGKH